MHLTDNKTFKILTETNIGLVNKNKKTERDIKNHILDLSIIINRGLFFNVWLHAGKIIEGVLKPLCHFPYSEVRSPPYCCVVHLGPRLDLIPSSLTNFTKQTSNGKIDRNNKKTN